MWAMLLRRATRQVVFLGEYPSLCVRKMHAVRTQCKNLAVVCQIPEPCQQGGGLRVVSGYFSSLVLRDKWEQDWFHTHTHTHTHMGLPR